MKDELQIFAYINIMIKMHWLVCDKHNFILRCYSLFLHKEYKNSINSSAITYTDICVDMVDLDGQKSLWSISIPQ